MLHGIRRKRSPVQNSGRWGFRVAGRPGNRGGHSSEKRSIQSRTHSRRSISNRNLVGLDRADLPSSISKHEISGPGKDRSRNRILNTYRATVIHKHTSPEGRYFSNGSIVPSLPLPEDGNKGRGAICLRGRVHSLKENLYDLTEEEALRMAEAEASSLGYDMHIITNDSPNEPQHIADAGCWCEPYVVKVSDVTGAVIFKHRRIS